MQDLPSDNLTMANLIYIALICPLINNSIHLCIVTVNSLGLDNLSQAMGYMMVFRASSIGKSN